MTRDLIRALLMMAIGAGLLAYGFSPRKVRVQTHGSGVIVSNGRASCYVIQGTPYARGSLTCPSGVVIDHITRSSAATG